MSDTNESTSVPTQLCCGERKPHHSEDCPSLKADAPFTFHIYGWVCPVCGRGNAPFSNVCPCQDQVTYGFGCEGGLAYVPPLYLG